MDCAEIGVLEETDEVRFRCFLECEDRLTLKSEVGLELLRDFSDESLEGQLSDEQVGLLIE